MSGATEKTEVDVTVLPQSDVRKLSRSCEVEATHALSFPAALLPKAKGCDNEMRRTEIGNVRIEEWRTSSGRLLEVSRVGSTSDDDLAAFRALVEPLFRAGVVPLDRSKTEAGSEC